MDKELIRIIIIATGLVVIILMLLWGYLRNQRASRDMSYFEDDQNNQKVPAQNFNAQNYADDPEDLDLDLVPLGSARDDDDAYRPAPEKPDAERAKPSTASKIVYPQESKFAPAKSFSPQAAKEHLPSLIQFSIAAKSELGFNGGDLAEVFNMVGLEYGSMKIFERLDINRMVDFGVASMVNPGTFPASDAEMAEFYTPGITFFMQPRELPDPVLVFDDLVRTFNLIAKELDGKKLDAERKTLTDFTLKLMRKELQAV